MVSRWCVWPISATMAASVTAVLLRHAAVRNGRPAATCRFIAMGGALVFLVPAAVLTASTRVGCSDTGFGLSSRLPGLLWPPIGLVAAAALIALHVASGPALWPWLLPALLGAIFVVGLFGESFLTLVALSYACDDGAEGASNTFLYVQAVLALVAPAMVIALARLTLRRDTGPTGPSDGTLRAW